VDLYLLADLGNNLAVWVNMPVYQTGDKLLQSYAGPLPAKETSAASGADIVPRDEAGLQHIVELPRAEDKPDALAATNSVHAPPLESDSGLKAFSVYRSERNVPYHNADGKPGKFPQFYLLPSGSHYDQP